MSNTMSRVEAVREVYRLRQQGQYAIMERVYADRFKVVIQGDNKSKLGRGF